MKIKLYKYRIKTKAEFLNEFGDRWRDRVECSFVTHMDPLLGRNLENEYYKTLDYYFSQKRNIGSFGYQNDELHISCDISVGMVKKIDLKPKYKPRKLVY